MEEIDFKWTYQEDIFPVLNMENFMQWSFNEVTAIRFCYKEILRAKAIIIKILYLINNDKLNNLFNDTDDDDYDDIENNPQDMLISMMK